MTRRERTSSGKYYVTRSGGTTQNERRKSYNITSWRTKTLDGLTLPLMALYPSEDTYFEAPKLDVKTGTYTISGMDGTEIKGAVTDGVLTVSEIHVSGEGSGTTLYDWLLPGLEQSTGVLVASLVWEGGESISRLDVRNGTVTHEDVEV